MPITTNLSVSPYFDDYQLAKDYYKILFKPSVAIQTREMNQLQTILQNQIEQFGDNIYDKGTIISGCNFQYYSVYPYVKINDLTVSGLGVTVNNYVGLFANNSANLTAYILQANAGYQSQNPNLNTLYVRYVNSGNTGTATAFNAGDILTLFDANNSIFSVTTPVGGTGTGFSNADFVVFMPAITINNTASISGTLTSGNSWITNISSNTGVAVNQVISSTAGGIPGGTVVSSVNATTVVMSQNFTGTTMAGATVNFFKSVGYGNTINDPVSFANAVVVGVNSTAVPGTLVLNLAPYSNSLTNPSINSASWTFNSGNTVLVNGSTPVTINSIIGSGAAATPETTAAGTITNIIMTNQGNGYTVPPYVSIKTSNTSANVQTLSLTALNYATQVTVGASPTAPVGTGYAFGVSEGIIYQKGYFLYVSPQTVVVSKYSNVPDQVYVGFNTSEAIINSNIDPSLLDNASGSLNYQAPGADRLQLTPQLVVLNASQAEGNTNFFPITAFSNGNPYLQNQTTQYSTLGSEMAQRTLDTAGDFVLDPFLLTTGTSPNYANGSLQENINFQALVDPGYAYVGGERIKTYNNYSLSVPQGTTTLTSNSVVTALNYGNYITVNQVGGIIDPTIGDMITFYDSPKQYYSNTVVITGNTANAYYLTGNTAPATNSALGTTVALGTARVRAKTIVAGTGTPGSPNTQYNLYLFDVNMYSGANFANVRSVAYSSSTGSGYSGVADIVTTTTSTGATVAAITNTNASTLLFYHGASSTANAYPVSYIYRNIFSTIANSSGLITVSSGANFPYSNGSTLSSSQLYDLNITPVANMQASANVTGTAAAVGGSNTVVFTSSQNMLTTFYSGDYIKVFSNSSGEIRRVSAVINSSAIALDTGLINTNATSNAVLYFPTQAPINMQRTGRAANVDSLSQTMTINLANTLTQNSSVRVECNILANNPTPSQKTTNRNTYVKLNLANVGIGGTSNTTGPWCLGIPDIFRMKAVWIDTGTNIVSATNVPTTAVNVINQFYIDHKQNSDYYGAGYLYLKSSSSLSLSSSQGLLVEFDHFTVSSPRFYAGKSSYPVDDTQTFTSLNSTVTGGKINTFEIPELVDGYGNYYDLIDQVDFRPRVANTAVITANSISSATINPPVLNANSRFGANSALTNLYFPAPGSAYTSNLVYYTGRIDRVVVDQNGLITSIPGNPGVNNLLPPPVATGTLTINLLNIPPYPSIPTILSNNYISILDKGIASQVLSAQRVLTHTISAPNLSGTQQQQYQPVGYTMAAIGALEARIAALETYVSLNGLEQAVNNLTIPSSVTPSLNRFKYGFFADNFQTTSYSAVLDPEYSASIIQNQVTAKQSLTNLEYDFNFANVVTAGGIAGSYLLLPYTQYTLISQPSATNGAVIVVTSNTTTNTTSNTTTNYVTPNAHNGTVIPPPHYYGTLISSPTTFTIITQTTPATIQTQTSTATASAGGGSAGYFFAGSPLFVLKDK